MSTHPEPFGPEPEAIFEDSTMPRRLPTPFEWYGAPPLTCSELLMYQLSWTLRSKPDWQAQAADPTIRAKWREEAIVAANNEEKSEFLNQSLMKESMIDYVLAELEGHARISDKEAGIERGCFEGIWYSDRIVSDEALQRLKNAVRVLEDEETKDWHPGSDGQVLVLIDHSLYGVVYGRTHAYLPNEPRIRDNYLPAIPQWVDTVDNSWRSEKFMWLPSDFFVEETGAVKLLSPYINNLHPERYEPLYRVIEEIIATFVPLWERVLGDANPEGRTFPWHRSGRMKPVGCVWGPNGEPYPVEIPEGEDEDIVVKNVLKMAPKYLPEATVYDGQLEKRYRRLPLRERTIQCIIQMANIHLTPEKPEYESGDWEIEGMANERIAACATYCYEEENIKDALFKFRVSTDEPEAHEIFDNDCMQALYGLDDDDPCVQEIGAVSTQGGRVVAWSNLFEHLTNPCSLADFRKPGYRKLFTVFLVDPSADRVTSTSDVAPQQSEWAADALMEAFDSDAFASDGGSRTVGKLPFIPQELRDIVRSCVGGAEGVMTLHDAEQERLRMMDERYELLGSVSEKIFGAPFRMQND
uniref:Uncharacterized protein n=1 Tax=Mycena chlorophos TaxID=658473 RepID=A0ABQ0LJ31_MYCCL|nr:predicted protein [Mycena chlorophos]